MSGAQPAPVQPQAPTPQHGIVKQVLSGDTIVIRGKTYPPREKTISLSSITAPKLARRVQNQNTDSEDEPWAWEAREFLRKKLIGQVVSFHVEKTPTTTREYGVVFLTSENGVTENMTEALVKEGLAWVRNENIRSPTPEMARLIELQDQAKSAKKGKWSDDNPRDHVRNIKWTVDNMMNFVDKLEHKPMKAVIEHVRDGSTVRAFLLPDFTYITLMMCGIRSPTHKLDSEGKPDTTTKVDWAEEAKYFTETRLLQQDVEIVLESINNNNFVGTVLHPKGNIAEELLKAGFAKCVDWSMTKMKKADSDKLKKAEKLAQEKRLRIWADYTPPAKISDKDFVGTVIEVINGDALVVKKADGTLKKIFLASIRPPRDQSAPPPSDDKPAEPRRSKRPLYDIPWMFEAREFLRKKLIGKKVNVTVDYIQPARESLPEKLCCTVTISNVNVAEAMLSKGYAWLIHHKQTDDQRASGYDALIAAENKAMKGNKGVHSKKDVPVHRVNDICGDPVKAKNLLPHIKRSDRIEALVEFCANGSRLRLFLPKDSHLIIFLLSGVEVRYNPNDGVNNEEAATNFTKERCLQRDVEIQVEAIDKNGNFTGWLWVDKVNLSVALVEAGLAKIHFTGLNSKYAKELQNAKNTAKANGRWKYIEKEEAPEVIEVEDKTVDRKMEYKEVLIVETGELTFWCQYAAQGQKLNALQAKLSQEMAANPPLAGSYTPKRGDLCAAKYPVDDSWYRAKIEKVSGTKVTVLYVDYGNRAEISSVQCASLPSSFGEKPFANQYSLAFVGLPPDPEDQKMAAQQFQQDVQDRVLLLNFEYSDKAINYVTLYDPDSKEDVGKNLVADGFLLVQKRRERRMEDVMKGYQEAENAAKSKRLGMWIYGDVREDDDKEFGMGR
uniref:Staphylococcal nuclease domain-containing protein 1 n=1 Tax=Lygus hesperus TaxID=30085 RepID=A0A0A9XU00_LYGHE